MLCQFTFKNFKSYKNETVFDLQATSVPEFSDSLICDKSACFLPVSVLYGPNGGGKTNLLQALSCLISTVVKPIHDLGKNRNGIILQHTVYNEPFLFDDYSRKEPTEFEIFFRYNDNEYKYCLSLFDDEIVAESLYWRKVGGRKIGTVYEREQSVIQLGPRFNKASINRSVNPKMPYLSFLAINYDIDIIREVQLWFESCIVLNYAHSVVENRIMVSSQADDKSKLLRALNDLGIDLSGYRIDDEEKRLYTQRNIGGKMYELILEDESEGTKKLISVLPIILLALENGNLILIDELDAKLHPKLLKYIIALFKRKEINKKGAQLVFTSQDMTTMKNTVFRRDEIWFAASNNNHESEIYSLYEIRREDNERINNTAAYDKQYLEGRYGADPYLLNMLGEEWE